MIQPAVYRIVSARRDFDRVISLENDNPRGNLVVEKLDESADRQKWAVVNQFDEIYTFKSQIKTFNGSNIPPSKRPYAQNSLDDDTDPYIHGSLLDVLATYKILPVPKADPNGEHEFFRISLPGRPKAWTIVKDTNMIALVKYDDPDSSEDLDQLWKFVE